MRVILLGFNVVARDVVGVNGFATIQIVRPHSKRRATCLIGPLAPPDRIQRCRVGGERFHIARISSFSNLDMKKSEDSQHNGKLRRLIT